MSFSPLLSLNTAVSDPLLAYLQTYLIDFTELQYSTLIRALKIFANKGQYGAIQVFSADTSNPRKLMFTVNTHLMKTYDEIVDIRLVLFVFLSKNGVGIALCKFHPSYMENVDLCFRLGRARSALLQF
ncbi:hypothetical protein AVEN_27223-1 [Araneus ventricosus]|uniref:Uncharacterized protein n=1 Tax=Araneus ventricosus TaxID=182803 RepID=A0A4Y2C9J6_ARAVE|nr:hypothetical protein AVEN_27223-1 [Araneus ventricosus]